MQVNVSLHPPGSVESLLRNQCLSRGISYDSLVVCSIKGHLVALSLPAAEVPSRCLVLYERDDGELG